MSRLGHRVGVTAAFCSVLAAASLGSARAADWPLRGAIEPAGYARWDGWQVGAQFGVGTMRSEFANITGSMVAFILRNTTIENEFAPSNWATLSSSTTNGQLFGAFLGYNMQWDRLVVGLDMNYKYASTLQATSADSIARQFTTSDGFNNAVSITASASMKLVDYATLRGRAGYAFGNFLPYAVIGAAVGRFNYDTTVTVHAQGTPPAPPNPNSGASPFTLDQTATNGKSNAIVGGIAAGLGMDWAITPGLFLRAEWEYVAFSPVNGSRSNVNTGQLGVGMRF
jgi:opacity protein-like surface antigen